MSIPTIRPEISLETLWDECVHTESMLLSFDDTSGLAPHFTQFIARIEEVESGQRDARRKVIRTNARVASLNLKLDPLTIEIDTTFTGLLGKDPNHPRRRRYFKSRPSEVVHLGLGSQIEVMRDWPASLATEPEPVLQNLAPRLLPLIEQGEEAIKARAAANAERSDHRVREILTLIEDANALRRSVYGDLTKFAANNKLDKNWPRAFFRSSAE